ncbi:MAG: MFS transporter [Thermincola sp.]|jgi:MFS family permease|nr:MFS transporter [Thermincola sp.]MDT3704131.1 MFS transporter [Thermincola sp.]
MVKNNKWVLLILCWLTWGFIFADRMVITFVAPLMVKDLNISMTQFGLTMSAVTITWLIMAAVGGNLSDRVGRVKVIVPAIFWFSILTTLVGFARGFKPLLFLRGLIGLGEGSYWGPGVALINESWPPERRGIALGFHQTGSPFIGVFLTGIVSGLIAARWGWRAPFWVFGICGIVTGLLFWLLIKEPKNEATHEATSQPKVKVKASQVLMSSKEYVFNLIILFFVMVMYWSISSFLPIYLSNVKGLAVSAAGSVAGITGLVGMAGMILSGLYSDYIGRRAALIISLVGVLVGLPMLFVSNSMFSIMLASIILGYAIYAPFPLCLAIIPGDVIPNEFVGTAAGITLAVGEIGGIVGPILGGYLNDLYGITASFWLAFGAAIIAGILSLVMKETAPRIAKPVDIGKADLSS